MSAQPGPIQSGPPGPAPAREIRPAGWWYAVGIAVLVVSVAAAVAWAWSGLSSATATVDHFQRADVPSATDVRFTETGGYTVYLEYPGATSRPYSGNGSVGLVDSSGTPVGMAQYSSRVTYRFGDHEGRAALSFTISRRGTYHLTAKGPAGLTIAIGRGVGDPIVHSIVGAIALGVIGSLIGLAILIITAVRRLWARRGVAYSQS